jgi:hypothetical protein
MLRSKLIRAASKHFRVAVVAMVISLLLVSGLSSGRTYAQIGYTRIDYWTNAMYLEKCGYYLQYCSGETESEGCVTQWTSVEAYPCW